MVSAGVQSGWAALPFSISVWASMKFCGLSKQPLFLSKYSRVDTARSFLHVVEAFLEVNSCKVLDFKAVFWVKHWVKRRFHVSLSVVIVLRAFRARFGIRALCHVNGLLLMSFLPSAVDFSWQSEMRSVYKIFFLLG